MGETGITRIFFMMMCNGLVYEEFAIRALTFVIANIEEGGKVVIMLFLIRNCNVRN